MRTRLPVYFLENRAETKVFRDETVLMPFHVAGLMANGHRPILSSVPQASVLESYVLTLEPCNLNSVTWNLRLALALPAPLPRIRDDGFKGAALGGSVQ